MKRNIFIALAAFAICSSCSDSYYLPETEQDLAQLNSEYDDVKAKEADDEGEKIETLASEAEIQASMDEYKAELMNRESVAKERVMRDVYAAKGVLLVYLKSVAVVHTKNSEYLWIVRIREIIRILREM